MAKRVNEDNFEEEVLLAKEPVVVDFYSDSCVPCKQLSVLLGELEEDYEDKLKLVKVNVNFDLGLADKYKVKASPTLLFLYEGKEHSRLQGGVKKAVIAEHIEQIINLRR